MPNLNSLSIGGVFLKGIKMKKILFPTDFSETADNAFLYALALSDKLNGELTLLHVYELPELGRALKTTTKEVYEMMEMEALESFKASVKKLRQIAEEEGFSHIDFSHEMVEGETVSRISQVADKIEADIIVMGTKGATGLKEIFLGSIATGVIDSSDKPVLSIPAQASYKNKINKIGYLSNYKDEEIEAFEKVCEFTSFFNAELMCIHYDGEELNNDASHREEWIKKANTCGTPINFHVIAGPSFEDALVDFNQKNQINILAVQPRKKNIFARLFSKSVSKSIAHHLDIPLLSLPKK